MDFSPQHAHNWCKESIGPGAFILKEAACRFNSTVFASRLPADLEIAWSAHLKTTAGTTHFRREPPSLPFAGPRYVQSQQAFQFCTTSCKGRFMHHSGR